MKRYIFFFSICLIFSSCRKDVGVLNQNSEPIPTPIVSKGYFPLSVGNYWVYKKFTKDTLGNLLGGISLDTVKVRKDTTINGKIFYEIKGHPVLTGNISVYYCRDSADYIIYPNGYKFSLTNFTDTLKIDTM